MNGNDDQELTGGATDPAAGGGDGKEAAAGAAGQDGNQGNIPLEEHQSQLAALQQQIDELKDQNQLYRLQSHLGRQGGAGEGKSGANAGFWGDRDEEDVPTVGELRQFEAHIRQQFGGAMGEMRLSGQKTDYEEVVKTHLPNFLRANPSYIEILNATPPHLRARLAYDLGVQDRGYQAKQNQRRLDGSPDADAQRIAQNKRKPAPGGKGASSPLSKAGIYETMDMGEELEKRIQQVKMGLLSE